MDTHEKYNIINIDHHHDWCYNEEQHEEKFTLNCGNWGKWCYLKNILNNFTWINNESSIPLNREINEVQFNIYDFKNYDINSLPSIDELYICLSPEFVPPYQYPLFTAWMKMVGAFYNKEFNFED